MGEFFYIGMGGIAAQRKMKQVLAEPLKVQSGTGQLPKVDPDQPVVQLRDVHFGYGELTVLSGASLAIHPGEHVAIVGPSWAHRGPENQQLLSLFSATNRLIPVNCSWPDPMPPN